MRIRTLIFVGIGILIVVIGGITAAAGVLLSRFETIEAAATRHKATQVLRAFAADLRQLDISTRDYAEWDDAEAFVRSRDPAFLKANFNPESLGNMHVDVVWLVGEQGENVYSAQFEAGTHALIEPASPGVQALLRRNLAQLQRRHALSATERLLSTDSGVLAVSAFEIRRSDISAPSGVTMLFGRYIRADVLQRVVEASGLDVRMVELPAGRNLGGSLPAPVNAWLTDARRVAEPLPLVVNDARIDGYVAVHDITGKPVVIFATRLPRDISALGRRSTLLLLGAIAALVVCAMLAIFALVLRVERSWKARNATERRHHEIVSHLEEAVLLIEAGSGRIVEANAALQRLSGYSAEELCALNVVQILTCAAGAGELRQGLQPTQSLECGIRTRDGARRDAEISVVAIEEEQRQLLCVVARDITPRKQAERQQRDHHRQLSHMAHHDALTGLPNRLYLQERLPRVLHKVAGSDRLLALLYVDIDHFKNINDSLGHGSGDQALRVVAKRLRACARSGDVVVRMGGDEFVVVATLLPSRASVDAIARKILVAMQAPIALSGNTVQVSASLGISLFPQDGLDMESLLKHADIALYQAKEAGRNNYQFFQTDMSLQLSEQVALEQALRHAFGTTQLYLEYQPIVDLAPLAVVSFEALCRWRHPELGLVPPARFIAAAETSGLIVQLGEHVLRQACWQLQQWQASGVGLVPVGVNVSPLQLARTDFAALVRQATHAHGVDPRWLNFEITESALLAEAERHIATLEELRRMGCKIAIDDFGTGYSTFSYLKRLPVDTLKIDGSFVRELTTKPADAAIVRGIIEMARGMQLGTVAEGVETAQQLALLRGMGCERGQGYGFSRPISARRCHALLNALDGERRWSNTMLARALTDSQKVPALSGSGVRAGNVH